MFRSVSTCQKLRRIPGSLQRSWLRRTAPAPHHCFQAIRLFASSSTTIPKDEDTQKEVTTGDDERHVAGGAGVDPTTSSSTNTASDTAKKSTQQLIMPQTPKLIKTDLQQHLNYLESQKPSFETGRTPDSHPDPTGVVPLDLTEHMIDMKDFFDPEIHLADAPDWDKEGYEEATPLANDIIAYLSVRNFPMTVAEFMRQALTHPEHGYYTTSSMSKDDEKDDWDDDDIFNDDVDDWDKTDGDGTEDKTTTSSSVADTVIGSKGDFVTAPEVSQIFGECLTVWFVLQWQSLHRPHDIQLLEVGPGKGTLICDMLRSSLTGFRDFGKSIRHVHLVEASPFMREEQRKKLEELQKEWMAAGDDNGEKNDNNDDDDAPNVRFEFHEIVLKDESSSSQEETTSMDDDKNDDNNNSNNTQTIHVTWHQSFATVKYDAPQIPTFVVCQELLDALPVHAFEKTKEGWRERMLDVAVKKVSPNNEDGSNSAEAESRTPEKQQQEQHLLDGKKPRLRLVCSQTTTPALKTLLNVDENGNMLGDDSAPEGAIIEVSPEGILLAQDLATLLEKNRGAGLIVDYGFEGSTDSLRGFYRHKQVPFFSRPGEIDITADVDFQAVRHGVNNRMSSDDMLNTSNDDDDDDDNTKDSNAIVAHGPVTQSKFLASMGAMDRVVALIEDDNTSDEEADEIYKSFERLVSEDQMGERYKVLSLATMKDGIFAPPGF